MGKTLAGKVALVTGAGKNIGRAVALNLARGGAAVVVNGRADKAIVEETVAEIDAAGGTAMAHLADITDEQAVAGMVAAVEERFGRLDILVSNPGLRRQTPFLEMSFSEWREILSVALDGAFILSRAAIPLIIKGGEGGAFIAMSGISNHVGTANRCHVNASKAGLEGFIRGLAIEMAEHRITCNAVAPGAVDTVRGATAGALPSNLADRGVPLGRKARVEEIAATVRYLAGPGGAYTTGQTIHVNGGVFLA